ncbi:unnamed protein product [Cuscuta europaea]|uniref:Reverse transcriptase zinc-binding domain-containing protein n=1 Tax=Cuscuta europaea TaxID=41803 RepID=A0A9P0ZBS4_CUSEU|nr:unnamed protein product [Cuscuta europaea]
MPTYTMNVFLLPNELCREIEVLMNGYWWKGKSGKGIRWKDWASLSKLKKAGGMGFRRLKEFNLAMLAKQAWRIFTNPGSLVSRVFKARCYPKGDFLSASLGYNPSFIWRSLFETQEIIKGGYKWRVGDGKSIKIWEDPWLPDRENPRVISDVGLGLEQTVVANLMDESGKAWDMDVLRDLFDSRDVGLIQTKVCSGCLPTKENLCSRRVDCSDQCGLCGTTEESLSHIFLDCAVAKEAWSKVAWSWTDSGASHFLEQVQQEFQLRRKKDLMKMIWGCWGIWCERNRRVWRNTSSLPRQVMLKAEAFVVGWCCPCRLLWVRVVLTR